MSEDRRLNALKRAITERGWRWRPGKTIPYGVQLLVDDASHEATLDFYPKRGRTVVGGAASPLRTALGNLAADLEGVAPSQQRPSAPSELIITPPPPAAPELGMDESGKGDWFGPLVVAAVYLTPADAGALLAAGVRDSKLLSADGLRAAAAAIEAAVPPAAREVLALAPAEYNRRYAEVANINLLLSDLYAEVAGRVVARTGVQAIVCDQFAQRVDRLNTAFARAGLPHPRQLHHAEADSLAVAAASVLASARFQAELARLGRQAGLGQPLPKGASAVRELTRAAHTIIAREGPEGLGHYAKLTFKPVQALLGATGET